MLALIIEVPKYFFSIIHPVSYLVKECSRKKYSVTQMMLVVIQLIISHKEREGRVHGRPQESKQRRSPPPPEKSI